MGATDSAPSLKAAVLTGSVRTIDAKRCFAKNDAREQRASERERIGRSCSHGTKKTVARLARWQKNA